MMKNNTGYREMLRDRCPKVVSFALKWCKAKEKWLNYVYNTQIWILSNRKERLIQTRLILGYNEKKKRNFVFNDTIFWKGLDKEETEFWKDVSEKVEFFQKNYAYIQNMYEISKECGKPIASLKLEIITNWLREFCPTTEDSEEEKTNKAKYVNDLADYLIDCFEGNIQ